MNKTIDTLVIDIQKLITTRGWFTNELETTFGSEVSRRIKGQFAERQGTPTLRLSQMGPRCPKALWHSIHTPHLAEALPPWAEMKYSFGHLIEALAINLARAADHEVTGEQDAVELDGVMGHRDCVIDGCVVDVKSTSSRSFGKFKYKGFKDSDSFGYLDQLDGYVLGAAMDPLVQVKDKGYILAIDKQLGHMVLYEHTIREQQIRDRIKYYKQIVGRDAPPDCTCRTIPFGLSGNTRLDTKASYNPYKFCCFPLLRTFVYSDGPVYLTKVVRKPDVPEITRQIQGSPILVLPPIPEEHNDKELDGGYSLGWKDMASSSGMGWNQDQSRGGSPSIN